MTTRVLAVVDSESFLKWAATSVDRILEECPDADGRVVIINGPLRPSVDQVRAALAGTRVTECPVVTRRDLARIVRTHAPDVVLIAATGPVAEMIAISTMRVARHRPAFLSGAPGMALAAKSTSGVTWRRRWCDGYIVHSPREAEFFAAAFARAGAAPRMVLTRLPFLARRPHAESKPVHTVVFAPQSIVPHARPDRVALLEGLAHVHRAGFRVVVKTRTRPGEQQTHHEALPFDRLWDQEHGRIGLDRDALEFAAGPMSEWLVPGNALVTVSSTAAVEGMAAGIPTALVADFGVGHDLVNEVYEDSGCLVSISDLAEVLRAGGPVPDAAWLAANYLHEIPSELGSAVEELAGLRSSGSLPIRSARPNNALILLYSKIKSDFPVVWYPAKLVRTVLGRFRQVL